MRRKRKAVLLLTLALGFGGTAAMAQGNGHWSYSGAKPPKLPAVQNKTPNGPPVTLPAQAAAQLARIEAEGRRTGRTPPMPAWNEATNDVHRIPDGSVKLFDLNETPVPEGPPCATPKDCRP